MPGLERRVERLRGRLEPAEAQEQRAAAKRFSREFADAIRESFPGEEPAADKLAAFLGITRTELRDRLREGRLLDR